MRALDKHIMKPTNGYQGWQVHRRSGTAINYVLATNCRVNERRENASDSPNECVFHSAELRQP